MKDNFVYLDYNQVMSFMFELNELRKDNPYFNDKIVESFEDYVLIRANEIAITYPQIKLKIFPNANKYKISKSLFEYLTRLTSIDVFDKETMKKYNRILEEERQKAIEKLLSENEEESK